MPFFPRLPAPLNPWTDFPKNCAVDYVGDPISKANIWISMLKGDVSAHAGICHHHASIFRLLFFFVFLTFHGHRPPVGPIIAVMA